MKPDPALPTYRLTLRALPSDVPPEVRLRRVLKALLRCYEFRCQAIEQLDGPRDGASVPDAAQAKPGNARAIAAAKPNESRNKKTP